MKQGLKQAHIVKRGHKNGPIPLSYFKSSNTMGKHELKCPKIDPTKTTNKNYLENLQSQLQKHLLRCVLESSWNQQLMPNGRSELPPVSNNVLKRKIDAEFSKI